MSQIVISFSDSDYSDEDDIVVTPKPVVSASPVWKRPGNRPTPDMGQLDPIDTPKESAGFKPKVFRILEDETDDAAPVEMKVPPPTLARPRPPPVKVQPPQSGGAGRFRRLPAASTSPASVVVATQPEEPVAATPPPVATPPRQARRPSPVRASVPSPIRDPVMEPIQIKTDDELEVAPLHHADAKMGGEATNVMYTVRMDRKRTWRGKRFKFEMEEEGTGKGPVCYAKLKRGSNVCQIWPDESSDVDSIIAVASKRFSLRDKSLTGREELTMTVNDNKQEWKLYLYQRNGRAPFVLDGHKTGTDTIVFDDPKSHTVLATVIRLTDGKSQAIDIWRSVGKRRAFGIAIMIFLSGEY